MNRYDYFLPRARTIGSSLMMMMVLLLAGTSNTTAQTLEVDSTFIDFGTVSQTGDTITRQFTVNNASSALLPLVGTVGQPTDPQFQVTDGEAFVLAPSQSQVVTVRFAPLRSGTYEDSLMIATNGGNAVVYLRARAAFLSDSSRRIAVDPPVLDYGNVPAGDTRQQSFTIRNTADSTAGDSTNILTGTVVPSTDPAFTIINGGGAFVLRRNESRVVTVQFSPTMSRTYLDSIRITSDAANDSGTTHVLLRGSSFSTADSNTRITVQPRRIDFGSVEQGSINERSFTITNSDTTTGSADTNRRLTGTVLPPGNAAFTITGGGGAFSLRRGESQVVTVRFMPTGGEQNYTDSIRITSNAVNDSLGSSLVYLLGRVGSDSASAARLFVDRENIQFGTVENGQVRTESFTIRNQDTSSTNGPIMGAIQEPANPAFTIISGGGGFSLNSGESRIVTVQYNPTGNQARIDTSSLRIFSNAGNSLSPRVVRLQGASSNPTSSVADASAIAGLSLRRNYPNPFSHTSSVEVVLPRAMHVTLALYNAQGMLVTSVADETFPAGEHRVIVNGESLASGVYYLQMQSGGVRQTLQITVQK